MTNRDKTCTAVAAIALLLSTNGIARADQPPVPSANAQRLERLYLEGMSAYREGQHRRAIRAFEQAYRIHPDPKLLYNAARSHEAIGDLDAAANRYRKCTSDPAADLELQDKARARLRLIERVQRERKLAGVEAPAPAAAERAVTPQRDASNTWWSVSKWGTAALGVAALATGGVVLALGLKDQQKLDDAKTASGSVSTMTRVDAVDLRDRADSKNLAGLVLLGTGAALAATSAVLFIFAPSTSERPTSSRQAWRPTFTAGLLPSGAALSLSSAF